MLVHSPAISSLCDQKLLGGLCLIPLGITWFAENINLYYHSSDLYSILAKYNVFSHIPIGDLFCMLLILIMQPRVKVMEVYTVPLPKEIICPLNRKLNIKAGARHTVNYFNNCIDLISTVGGWELHWLDYVFVELNLFLIVNWSCRYMLCLSPVSV